MFAARHRSSDLNAVKRRARPATTSLELIVALTLLCGLLSCSTPLLVKHGRLLNAQRDYRLALDELSNQLERLSALPEKELEDAVKQLTPSSFAKAHLPGAELRGQLDSLDIGRRVVLRLSWDEPQRRQAPVALAAWFPAPRSQQP
jgi:hypothetical protein